jgi:hypothetical protein
LIWLTGRETRLIRTFDRTAAEMAYADQPGHGAA